MIDLDICWENLRFTYESSGKFEVYLWRRLNYFQQILLTSGISYSAACWVFYKVLLW